MSPGSKACYFRPHSISGAVSLIGSEDVCLLAGGTDLVIMRSENIVKAERIVDLKGIASLSSFSSDDDSTFIGACVRLDDLVKHLPLPPNAIVDGASLVGGWQTRSRATIGGNICRASPAADTLCGLLVHGCRLELSSLCGQRFVPASEFFLGPGKTAMRRDELLSRIIVPARPGRSAYQRFTYRNAMDLSVAGIAVYLEVDGGSCVDASIALGACGPRPTLVPRAAQALIGTTLDKLALDAAAEAVIAEATPIDDVRGTRKHRLHVLRPLTHRVTRQALERAMERHP